MGGDNCGHIVLVDMDNTLVDYDSEFEKRWNEIRPEDKLDVKQNREYFEIEKNFDKSLHDTVRFVISSDDFFRQLKPYEGAIEALRELEAEGLHVKLCTSPSLFQYEQSAASKYHWVREWLGEEWLPRLIITRDKSVVRGRVLIDDKPSISGACERPEWQQVVFEQPYNMRVRDKPRMKAWSEWRSALTPFFPRVANSKDAGPA